MATNLDDWRRIDVEQYDPDFQYEADALEQANPLSTADIATLEQTATQALNHGKTLDALKAILPYAPYGADQSVRDSYLKLALSILGSSRVSDIPSLVNQLNLDEVDATIKFCYNLMSKPYAGKQSGLLLVWIDKIVEKFGEGPIVRFISDPAQL